MRSTRLVVTAGVLLLTSAASGQTANTPTARQTAAMIGLSPESLVVAEVTVSEVQAMMGRLEAATPLRDLLSDALRAMDAEVVILTQLAEEIFASGLTEQLDLARLEAEARLEAARAEAQSAQEILFALAAADLDTGRRERLDDCRDTLRHSVDPSFRVLFLESSHWRSLARAEKRERAFAAAEAARAKARPLTTTEQALLHGARVHSDVEQAQQLLATQLEAVRAALNG